MNKIIIAIDGFSSTGKSTIAKQLAQKLGYVYVDTGAMYRAVALFALEQGIISNEFFDIPLLITHLPAIKLRFVWNETLGFGEIYLNDQNVETAIRTLKVSSYVSKVAEISEVRSKLVEQQQAMGQQKGIVMDGRDIGTVVFPMAELKIFMTASAITRAQRRYDELIAKGEDVTFEAILDNVEQRDYIDTHREDSPLIQAKDAILIDNSTLTKEQQFDIIFDLAKKKTKM
ncbi:cytidylate kinase [Flavobacterium branchiophilum]|uniref:Cytidylate kinase n=1 Tax=Flavobacterium branchiophilum TaxID=55197 RepID=A0A2H3KJZ8_9FLAO|nr:(d)CMP kinase [Flavobacterium branchiophilum]OXA70227.1 cytidylate kinase [Flavobacterium branchiophilum] [Flavobacterium branchiophilum NBRC 15030 = ATCC 35035]PDS22738.1 (d)CMP kinase [Flavobacterium branchiophilum]TQM42356.1 cytidylate kinase [Flavobacterium branchiophilum]GEM55793.1 cytidylate kinase [Flavobacterium branchiophilum NBRC 15030 = ATCC 35035]